MRIAIVNQFAPPDESPTSVLAGELAEYLNAEGHDAQLIACDSGYRTRRSFRGSRLLQELRAHLSLFWKCFRIRRADLLLALSSPACLPATVCFAARIKRCRFAHWAMDVYPDVAVALGEVGAGSLVHKCSARLMRGAYRRASPLVALTPSMAEVLGHPAAEICPPWPPRNLDWPVASRPPTKPFSWLYSGNLGRAHLYRPLLLAQQKLEQRDIPAQLVFQGGGHSIAEAKALAAELSLTNCQFRDYAPRDRLIDTLFDADVLVATQSPDTHGLLWPSKLAVLEHIPRPLLWVGSQDPAVAADTFAQEDIDGIADWLEQQVLDPTVRPIPLHSRPKTPSSFGSNGSPNREI